MTAVPRAFIEIDLVQAEWVVTAYVCRDARMIEVVESGADPHVRTGSLISGAPEEFIRFDHKKVEHTTDPDEIETIRAAYPRDLLIRAKSEGWFLPRSMSVRQAGKKSNHGLNYNMKYKRFALENEMDERDGKRCYEYYHNAYPGLRQYYRAIEEEIRTHRRLENCFGYTVRFKGYIDDNLLDFAYSFQPQSTVGRITNIGLIRTYDADDSLMRDVVPVMQVHDSLRAAFPVKSPNYAADVAERISSYMAVPCTYHNRTFTLKRSGKIGPTIGDMVEFSFSGDLVANVAEAWESANARSQVR